MVWEMIEKIFVTPFLRTFDHTRKYKHSSSLDCICAEGTNFFSNLYHVQTSTGLSDV